jgi:PiT family inorganic phosphate transporter
MTTALAAVFGLAFLLAYANGANDVSRGIATLVGSGVTNFRRAMLWGTAWTLAGSLAAAAASQGLVATFAGKGFLAAPNASPAFLASIGLGAVAWVSLAARVGLPVSTTHSIVGALAGAAIVAQGAASLHWGFVAKKVALPLLLSPALSLLALYALFPLLKPLLASVDRYCLCLERRVAITAYGTAALQGAVLETAVVEQEEVCAASPAVAGRLNLVDGLHWLSSGATSFARALNDTPKIVALGLAASALLDVTSFSFYAAIALAMALGSLVGGFRVTQTLACRVTAMSHTEGFSANLVTSLLVGLASTNGLPVSTTHVSSGAIIGIGLHRGSGTVRWGTVREMAIAWLVTLPVAALVAAASYALLSRLG